MRTLAFSLNLLLITACGGEKNTSDSDTSSGSSESGGVSSEPSTGVTTSGTDTPTTGSSDASGTGSTTGASDPTTATVTTVETDTGLSTTATTTGATTTDATTDATTGESTAGETTTGESTTGDPVDNAIVNNDCAPNDGPALTFRLAVSEAVCAGEPVEDFFQIYFWQGGPLAPGVYPLALKDGVASFDAGGMQQVLSTGGKLTIASWQGDVVVGSYEIKFEDGSMRQGDFSGPFCQIQIGCG